YLLPGLAALRAAGELSDNFQLVAVGRQDWTNETFRNWAAAQLDRHATALPAAAKHTVAVTSRYHQADVTDPSAMTAVVQGTKPMAAYLALPCPPARRPPCIARARLRAASSCWRSRSAKTRSSSIAFCPASMPSRRSSASSVQNILGTRLANRVLEPIWNSA